MIYDLIELDIKDNLDFIIKYCDFYMDYCHDENLLIDGDLAGEIMDAIYIIEEISNKNNIDSDEMESLYGTLKDIHENLISLNDIKLFNHIHLVFSNITEKTMNKIKQRCNSIE